MDESANPYATPQANLELPEPGGIGEVGEPRAVPAGRGLEWIREGFELFRRSPGPWLGAVVIWIVIAMSLSTIPGVSIAVSLFGATITGGFMIGCAAQDRGGEFEFAHLFAGFKQNFGQLVLVGLYYLIATLFAMIVAFLMMMLAFGGVMFFGDGGRPEFGVAGIVLVVVVVLLLFVPLGMAYTFAPALAAVGGKSAIDALVLSFRGALKNLLPLIVWILLMIPISILAILPLGLGLLVAMPVFIASSYCSFKDVFVSRSA